MATKAIENTTNASFERASASLGNAITNHIQNNKEIILAFLVLQYTKKRKQYTSLQDYHLYSVVGSQFSV